MIVPGTKVMEDEKHQAFIRDLFSGHLKKNYLDESSLGEFSGVTSAFLNFENESSNDEKKITECDLGGLTSEISTAKNTSHDNIQSMSIDDEN